jgi:predicted nucleic acid-binding protein
VIVAIVVSDTSPIRALAHLNLLTLLQELFDEVLVPPTVDVESRSPPANLRRVDVRDLAYVQIQSPRDRSKVAELLQILDPGESEALALALELGVSAILIDEAAGRTMAKRMGLLPVGVLGLLVRAKQRGLLGEVSPLIDRLKSDLGFFISDRLRAEVLRLACEP